MSTLCILSSAAGCGSQSFVAGTASGSDDLLAIKVADYSGADVLSARADAVTEESRTVSLPAELTQDTPDAVVIALTPTDIVVTFDNGAAGRMNPTAKGRAAHASVGFRLAELQADACTSELAVGPFELTIVDGTVTVDPAELPIPAEALAIFRGGRLALCAETWADFDGTISLGEVAFETGRLHGHENRVTLCHMPLGEEGEAHTITVGSSAVDAHLAHGDRIGDCDGADDEDGHQGDDGAGGQPEGDDADGDADEDDGEDSGDSDEDGDDSDDDGEDEGGGDDTEGSEDPDHDGVPDDLDRCPNTPAQETADTAGCSCSQTDTDADSVNDCNDTCANTSAGLSVDANGCASDQLDDDGDAVMNDADACPNTAVGATVDANGCSCSQLDADNDGVTDCDDLCAQTPVGDDVGVDGCALVTIDANAGPDIATIVGVSIDVVAAATVLTGDYDEAALTFVWEQVTGDAVTLEANGPSLRVDTTGTAGTIVLRVTATTADGSAADSDDFTITIDSDAIQVDSASCDPATGHCYILARKSDGSNDQLWWDDAKVKANKMVHNGMRGHLPTITTTEERQFLAGVASNTPAMLGGADRDEEGVWVWADGPESGQLIEYLPWAASEPNDLYHWTYPEGEDYLQHEARGFNDINGARWYYVEFEPGWD